MHLLIAADVFFPDFFGGAGRVVYDVARCLGERGHTVTVVAPRIRRELKEEEDFGPFVVFRYRPYHRGQADRFFVSLWCARDALRRAIRLFGAPDVFYVHQPLSAMAMMLCKEAWSRPLAYQFQSPWASEYEIKVGRRGLGGRLRHWVEECALCRADRIVVMSRYMEGQVARLHPLRQAKVEVIPGGVDTGHFVPVEDHRALRDQLGLPAEGFVLLTVRNLVPRMGLENLVDAMSRVAGEFPGVCLLIGGRGLLEASLRERVAALGLQETVRFLGYIPEERLPEYYAAAGCFILPSRALEGFGVVTIEAMACGTPVLGTPVGGTVEILEPLEERFLARGTNPDALADAILGFIRLHAGDEGLRKRCRRYVEEHYSLDLFADRMESFMLETYEG